MSKQEQIRQQFIDNIMAKFTEAGNSWTNEVFYASVTRYLQILNVSSTTITQCHAILKMQFNRYLQGTAPSQSYLQSAAEQMFDTYIKI